jgi:hypothetical protein
VIARNFYKPCRVISAGLSFCAAVKARDPKAIELDSGALPKRHPPRWRPALRRIRLAQLPAGSRRTEDRRRTTDQLPAPNPDYRHNHQSQIINNQLRGPRSLSYWQPQINADARRCRMGFSPCGRPLAYPVSLVTYRLGSPRSRSSPRKARLPNPSSHLPSTSGR